MHLRYLFKCDADLRYIYDLIFKNFSHVCISTKEYL